MDKKSSRALDRLQRAIDSDRPDDDERQRTADQLITQDQLRRLDPRMKKLASPPPSRYRKGPPSAREIIDPRTPGGSRETAAQGPAGAGPTRWAQAGPVRWGSRRWR